MGTRQALARAPRGPGPKERLDGQRFAFDNQASVTEAVYEMPDGAPFQSARPDQLGNRDVAV